MSPPELSSSWTFGGCVPWTFGGCVLAKAISRSSAWQSNPVVVMVIRRGVDYKVVLTTATGSGLAS